MPSAVTATQQLLSAVRTRDANAAAHSLASFLHGVTADDPTDLATAGEVILASLDAFPRSPFHTALAIAALHHVGDVPADALVAVINATKHHEGDATVVQCAARLLHSHVLSPRRMDRLPDVSAAAARYIAAHPGDPNVSYWCGSVLVTAAGEEPDDVKAEHGQVGVDRVATSVVEGATATQRVEVLVDGFPWEAWVMAKLFPRLRARE